MYTSTVRASAGISEAELKDALSNLHAKRDSEESDPGERDPENNSRRVTVTE